MRSAWFSKLGLAAVAGCIALAGAGATTGCAGTRDEINRVQPNAIKKSDLVGDYRDLRGAPEWYMRNLITGVQRTNPYTSDGLQDLPRRVKFEIQEGYLVVRRSHELVVDSDGKGGGVKASTEPYLVKAGDTLESIAHDFGTKVDSITTANGGTVNLTPGNNIVLPGKANTGVIVAMYPITSHFDVKREYNPSTGEDTNILDENSTDRRWYEREYMRVDWSRNVVVDPDFFEFWWPQAFGELHMENVQFYENNPSSPEFSNFAEVPQGYFDITSRWLIQPQTVDYYGYSVPQCLLANMAQHRASAADGTVECNDQEVVFRSSFLKVPVGDKDTDYEVLETDGQQQTIVGTLDLHRYSYDRQYGIVDQTWHKFVQRYNIWDKSHVATACGENNDRKAGDDLCEAAHANSTCDLNAKKCTIPFEERKIRKIAFHADTEIPAQLVEPTGTAVKIWNEALMNAVAAGREAECRRVAGSDRTKCHATWYEGDGTINPAEPDKPRAINGPVAVFCHNPVAKGDDEACGAEGLKVRKGDIRYHMLAWWSNPSYESPLGVVVWSGDPLTGESIGSMANVFGGTFDHALAYYRDMIQLVNGDLTPSEFVSGKAEELYGTSKGVGYATDPIVDPALDALAVKIAEHHRFGDGMSKAEIDARMKAVDVTSTVGRLGLVKALSGLTTVEEKMKAATAFLGKQGTLGTPGFGGVQEYNKKMSAQMGKAIKGGLESQIVTPQFASSFGVDPKTLNNDIAMQQISPLRGISPSFLKAAKADYDQHWGSRACRMPSMEDAFTWNHFDGVAAKFKARYPDGATATGPMAKSAGVEGQTIDRVVRGKLIYQELAEPVYVDVLAHEMGHAMSEDHDFGGTWDSVNYYPQYWQLRTADGKVTKTCDPTVLRAKGSTDTCMGPRYLDPASADEYGMVPGKEHDALEEYGTASIMDYHSDSRYWPDGLGAYDKMAAKFIYGRVLETFDDEAVSLIPKNYVPQNPDGTPKDEKVTDVPKSIAPTLESMLGGDWQVKRKTPVGNFAQPMHYTEVGRMLNLFDARRCRPSTPEEDANGVAQYGKVCQSPHRDHYLVRDMADGDSNGAGSFTGHLKSPDGKYRWPYKYGPSDFAHYPHIAVFDTGADFYEVTQDIVNWYEFYYLSGFFRQRKQEWNPNHIQSWIYDRVYDRFHLLAWDSINSVVRYAGFFPGVPMDANAITTSDDWGKPEILSMTLLFDTMQRALLRPQPGSYVASNVPGVANVVNTVPEVDADPAKVLFKVGGVDTRYIDNAYNVAQNGYDYQAAMSRLGSFAEKPLAAIGLTDSTPPLSTVARETYLDGRNVMFSFRSALPQAFDRLVAGTFAEDLDAVAPYVVPSEKPDAAGMLPLHSLQLWQFDGKAIARPAGAKVVDPMLGYRTMVPAMILTLIFQPIDSNMELINRVRIWVEGSPEAVKIEAPNKMSFYDPNEGLLWGATKFGTETIDGRDTQVGIGARMLEHANRLLALAYNVKTDAQGLPLYAGDRPVVDGAADAALTVKNPAAAAKLKSYVGFLNQTRSALYWLGFGPLRWGLNDDF